MTSGVAPVRTISQSHSSSIPGPPCATARSPKHSPRASTRQNLLALARPVDANKPFDFFRHGSGPFFASRKSGPPRRASIPVLALEAQPPTGLPSRPTCRGAAPFEVLRTRGFSGDSRQAGPVRPIYNADRPNAAFEGYRDSNRWSPSRTDRLLAADRDGLSACRATQKRRWDY